MTLNIRTTKRDEGAVLRYWTDHLSPEQAEEVMDKLTRVLSNTVSQPSQTVMQLDKANRARQMKSGPEPATEQAATIGIDRNVINQPVAASFHPDMVRQLVAECVHRDMFKQLVSETVQQTVRELFKNTNLAALNTEQARGDNLMHLIGTKYDEVTNDGPVKGRARNEEDKIEKGSGRREHKLLSSEEMEEKLFTLWSEALDMPKNQIGADDTFFQLGGDSLIAMKMVGSAIESGVALTVADVFLNPVFADMLAHIRKAAGNQGTEGVDYNYGDKTQQDLVFDALDELSYVPFSLLKTRDVEGFLQEHICPQLNVFRGGIEDVLPVTDYQAMAITGSLLESRFMLNYFSFEGRGRLDLGRLKQSVSNVVRAYPILRTVFVGHGNQLLQVVLRNLEPDFSVFETEQDLGEFSSDLKEKDRSYGAQLGESFLRVALVRRKYSDHHCIIIRLSHAQYDGVSMPMILESLQAAYNEKPLSPGADFSNYVNSATEDLSGDMHDYWRNLLRGSSMTNIVSRERPDYNMLVTDSTSLSKTVKLQSLSSSNITAASVLKAAWAMVLVQTSATSDVIFGTIVNGRNAVVPGVAHAVGPCLNINPVRAKLRSGWTALDLLHDIQNQQVANMPHEMLGFREIIKNCTDWSDWTSFSSIMQHQNLDATQDYRFGETDYHVSATGGPGDLADISIVSTPKNGDNVEINLSFTKHGIITHSFAERLLDTLCTTAQNIADKPSMKLPSPSQISHMPRQTVDEIEVSSTVTSVTSVNEALTEREVLTLSHTVMRVWQQVLPKRKGRPLPVGPEDSFFDLGGDVVDLAQVKILLEKENFKLRLEDMIRHPLLSDQVALLSQQMALIQCNVSSSSEEDLKPSSHVEVKSVQVPPKFWRKSIHRAKSIMRLGKPEEMSR